MFRIGGVGVFDGDKSIHIAPPDQQLCIPHRIHHSLRAVAAALTNAAKMG